MPRYQIDRINYIVTGETEKIVNIDATRLPNPTTPEGKYPVAPQATGEIRNWSFVMDTNKDENSPKFSNSYNFHRLKKITDEPATDNRNIVYAAFDFKDVAVKSEQNNAMVYGPSLSANPVGFTQGVGMNAYGLTDSSQKTTEIKYTNLADTRTSRLSGNSASLEWQYKLAQTDATYTYSSLLNLKDGNPFISSYYDYIYSQGPNMSAELFMDLFTPRVNHEGIDKNYLYEFFMTNMTPGGNEKYNNFIEGEMQGNSFASKNMYDSMYSMNAKPVVRQSGTGTIAIEAREALDMYGIREYIGIGAVGGKAFLKYYDEGYWEDDETKMHGYSNDILHGYKSVKQGDSSTNKSYQNVERLDSINRFINKSNHKSNLYSIRVKNLGLDNYPELSANLNQIKNDIQNSVRMIAEDLNPAHTQLFKVYIED